MTKDSKDREGKSHEKRVIEIRKIITNGKDMDRNSNQK